jgi:O-antigen/teichoic acid export membrane protein
LAASARFAPLAVQLIATPFVISSAGVGVFAVWALAATTINLLLTADLGVVGVMQRYHGLARGRGDTAFGGRITATVLLALSGLLVLVLALGPLIAHALITVIEVAPGLEDPARLVFQFAPALAVLQLLGLAFSAYLAAHGRFFSVACASIFARLAAAVAIVVALQSNSGLNGLLFALFVDATLAVLIGATLCFRHLLREVRGVVRGQQLKDLWAYSWRNQASAIGFVLQRESDIIIAAILLPVAMQATTAAVAQLSAAIALAPVVFLVPLFTRLSVIAGTSRNDAITAAAIAELQWFKAVIPFAAIALSVGPFAVATWLGPQLADAFGISAILLLGFLIVLANAVRAVLVRAVGLPGLETRSYFFLIATKLLLGIPATLWLGIYGLAASTVIASVVAVGVMWSRSRRTLPSIRPGLPSRRTLVGSGGVFILGVASALGVTSLATERWAEFGILGLLCALLALAAVPLTGGRLSRGKRH